MLLCARTLFVVRFPQVFFPQTPARKDFAHEVRLFWTTPRDGPFLSWIWTSYQVHPENFIACPAPAFNLVCPVFCRNGLLRIWILRYTTLDFFFAMQVLRVSRAFRTGKYGKIMWMVSSKSVVGIGLEVTVQEQQGRRVNHVKGDGEMERYVQWTISWPWAMRVCAHAWRCADVRRQTVQQKNVRATGECVYRFSTVEELVETMKARFIVVGFDFATTLSSPSCSCILFAIVLRQLVKLKFWEQQSKLKWLILNRWRRFFHPSRVKFPLVNMSATWCWCRCNGFGSSGPDQFCQTTNPEQLCG